MSSAFDAIVIGGGVSGLVAAWELSQSGVDRIAVLDAAQQLGGCVCAHTIAGFAADAGAESFATRSGVIPQLLEALGIADQRVEPNPAGAWLHLPSGSIPMPKTGILGIPGDLNAAELRDILSPEGLERARSDAQLPVDDWQQRLQDPAGARASVAEVVLERMGPEVLELLVTPVVAGVHSADPATLDLETVAPGLLDAMVSAGSLAGGVVAQRMNAAAAVRHNGKPGERKPDERKPGAAVAGLRGGMNRLSAALVEHLRTRGVRLLTGTRVEEIQKHAHGYTLNAVTVTQDTTSEFTAARLVVATDGPTAVDLLAPLNPGLAQYRPPAGAGVALVSLAVEHPELDAAPRGTGVLVSPLVKDVDAKALTHASAKWEWIAETLGSQRDHRHLLRLSYGRVSDTAEQLGYASTDEALMAAAVADAAKILGVNLRLEHVFDRAVVRWRGALPFATIGHKERVATVRAMVADMDQLDVVGAWLSGTGLVAVISDTQKVLNSAG